MISFLKKRKARKQREYNIRVKKLEERYPIEGDSLEQIVKKMEEAGPRFLMWDKSGSRALNINQVMLVLAKEIVNLKKRKK